MELLNIINDSDAESFMLDFEGAINTTEYTSLSWAVSDYNDTTIDEIILPNITRFKHLFLSGEWKCLLPYLTQEGKDNSYKWKDKTKYAKEKLKPYVTEKIVHFIRAKSAFHPKVYLFYNDDHSRWKAFVGSSALTLSNFNTIESMAVLTQDDDDSDKTLFNSIMNMFTKSIPLSKNICGNSYLRKRAEKEEKEKQIKANEEVLTQMIAGLLNEIKPFIKKERSVEIFSKYIGGSTRKELAAEYKLSTERIRQLSIIKKTNLNRAICYLVKEKGIDEVKNRLRRLDNLEIPETKLNKERKAFIMRFLEGVSKAENKINAPKE